MKKLILATVLLIGTYVSQAQSRSAHGTDYENALGVKIWDGGGITFKHFISPNHAVEGIGYFYNGGFRLTGLYEIHGDINGAPGLKWYVGPGAHIGFYNDKYYRYRNIVYSNNGAVFGIDGVVGLDYKFNGAPINVSLDWQPAFEFASGFGFNGSWGGLGIRYTF